MLEDLAGGLAKRTHGPERGPTKRDLLEVVESLRSETLELGSRTIAQNPRTYILERTITPHALEGLGMLQFENSINDFNGHLHFQTGQKGSTLPDYTFADNTDRQAAVRQQMVQEHEARFTLHSHPASDWGFAVSSGDYDGTIGAAGEIHFIVTRDGIIGYKADNESGPLQRSLIEVLAAAFQNPNRTIRQQKERGIIQFFVPWRGDADSQRRLGMICRYMNDPTIKWASIKEKVEAE